MATSFEDYQATMTSLGYDETVVREWQPLQQVGDHSHPFDVKAMVVQGEMFLTCGDATRHLLAGDSFDLVRDEPHSERYGAEGATFWVGRRH